eukprot:Selendium_serpulae@DN5008_c0_g1_i1.p2
MEVSQLAATDSVHDQEERKRADIQDELNNLPDEIGADDVKRLLNAADDMVIETLTSANIKRVLMQFDMKIKKNQEMRIKHKDHPEKFLKSEVDLDEEIKKLKQLAATPELIPAFVDYGGLASLLRQITHVNIDIACETISVLEELTDPEVVGDIKDEEDAETFVTQLNKLGLPSLTMEVLTKIKEDDSPEDANAVTNCLKVLENMTELDQTTCDLIGKHQKFVTWLLKRIRKEKVDHNRVYGSEILNVILQNSESARVLMGRRDTLDGIDKLLRTIAAHRKRDPDSAEEEELMWNLFDCLSLLLLVPENQVTFGNAQGVELMIRMLRERKSAYRAALRLTNFALQNCPSNCQLFVEKLGLKSLFGIFLKRSVSKKKKSEEKEDDEHMTGIILSLCKGCTGMPVARVLNKFTENKCEKLERLLELHEHYNRLVEATDRGVMANREATELDRELEIDTDEQRFLDRCEAGLTTLHQIDNILVRLCNMGNTLVAQRVHILMDTKGVSIEQVNKVVSEYLSQLGPSAVEEKEVTSKYLLYFLKGEDSSVV